MFKMKSITAGLLAIVGGAIAQDVDYAQYVNPFIGSEGAIPGYACKLISLSVSYCANNIQMVAAMFLLEGPCLLAWSSSALTPMRRPST